MALLMSEAFAATWRLPTRKEAEMDPFAESKLGELETKIRDEIEKRREAEKPIEAIQRMQVLAEYLAEEEEKARTQATLKASEAAEAHYQKFYGEATMKRQLAARYTARAEAMKEIGRWIGMDLVVLGSHRLSKQQLTSFQQASLNLYE